MPFDTRPESPSQGLLDRARDEMARRLSLDTGSLRWDVGGRMDRKRSTLFHLTLHSASDGAVATAYYKVPYFPGERKGSRNLARAKEATIRGERLGNRFAELTEGSGISINVTLALDPDTLEVVTLGLEGRPMGNPLRHALTPARRQRALLACARVGRAVRIVESLPLPDQEDGAARIWREAERKLESVASMLSRPDLRRLEVTLAGLLDDALANGGIVLAHGDLGPENVVMMPDGTGLIDFMWTGQLKGFDLSRLVHRLRYTTLSYRPWTSALVGAVLDGYGDRSAPSAPGWRFSELQRLLATARGSRRRSHPGRPAERALSEIRSSL